MVQDAMRTPVLMRVIVCAVLSVACHPPHARYVATEGAVTPLSIVGVTIIDPATSSVRREQTVVIRDGRITAITPDSSADVPAQGRILDGRGKYLIPGLWDMHVHWWHREDLALTLANGVTGARVMWGDTIHHAWRRDIEAGTMLGPRQVIGSTLFDGPQPRYPGALALATADEARTAVRREVAAGADFIKVVSGPPRHVFLAIAEESSRLRVPFAGHVPNAMTAAGVSRAGQRTIEHLTSIAFEVSGREAELRSMPRATTPDGVGVIGAAAVRSFDEQRAAALFALFRHNDTWQCPTLVGPRWRALGNDSAFIHDPRLTYVAGWLRERWARAEELAGWTNETFARQMEIFEGMLTLVGAMNRAGVGLLAGTDIGNPYLIPGFSLHDELHLFVRAGLSPMEALQTATWNPARFLGIESDFGAVSIGRIADLVLLDFDPLEDIRNTQSIAAVIFGGRLLDRSRLDEILTEQERWAKLH